MLLDSEVLSVELGQNVTSETLQAVCLGVLDNIKPGMGFDDGQTHTFAQNEHLFLTVFSTVYARVFPREGKRLITSNIQALRSLLADGLLNVVDKDSGEIIEKAYRTSTIVKEVVGSSVVDHYFLVSLTLNEELDNFTKNRLKLLQSEWKLGLDIGGYGTLSNRDAFFTPSSICVTVNKQSGYPTDSKKQGPIWKLLYRFSHLYYQLLAKQKD